MKTSGIRALMTALVLAFPGTLPFALPAPPPAVVFTRSPGAANLTELGQALLQALQANNPDQLQAYLPTASELAYLKKKGSPHLKALVETRTPADIESQFKNDFQAIMQQTIARTLNWSDLSLAEVRAGKPAAGSRMLFPVDLRLQTKQNQLLTIRFEALRLGSRYYLFRRVQLA